MALVAEEDCAEEDCTEEAEMPAEVDGRATASPPGDGEPLADDLCWFLATRFPLLPRPLSLRLLSRWLEAAPGCRLAEGEARGIQERPTQKRSPEPVGWRSGDGAGVYKQGQQVYGCYVLLFNARREREAEDTMDGDADFSKCGTQTKESRLEGAVRIANQLNKRAAKERKDAGRGRGPGSLSQECGTQLWRRQKGTEQWKRKTQPTVDEARSARVRRRRSDEGRRGVVMLERTRGAAEGEECSDALQERRKEQWEKFKAAEFWVWRWGSLEKAHCTVWQNKAGKAVVLTIDERTQSTLSF